MGDDDPEAMVLIDGIPVPLPVSRVAEPTDRRDEPAADEATTEARVAQVCDDILAGRVALRQIFALETALQQLRLNLALDRAIRRNEQSGQPARPLPWRRPDIKPPGSPRRESE